MDIKQTMRMNQINRKKKAGGVQLGVTRGPRRLAADLFVIRFPPAFARVWVIHPISCSCLLGIQNWVPRSRSTRVFSLMPHFK